MLAQWLVHWNEVTSTTVSTWMGDHPGRSCAVNLHLYSRWEYTTRRRHIAVSSPSRCHSLARRLEATGGQAARRPSSVLYCIEEPVETGQQVEFAAPVTGNTALTVAPACLLITAARNCWLNGRWRLVHMHYCKFSRQDFDTRLILIIERKVLFAWVRLACVKYYSQYCIFVVAW